MFLPTTPEEVKKLGWRSLDIILVSGDSYIDSPFMGTAVIGKLLAREGYRVGIIAQPETNSLDDIGRLGEPELFWGVTAGSIDSMVANYTALKKKRRSDDYTPGGLNNRRPDRASIAYSNLIRRFSKMASPNRPTAPIVLGGIEASLRRVPHYDFWTDSIRRSILFDAKADYLLYGMAEKTVLAFALAMRKKHDPKTIRGLSYISKEPVAEYLEMPSFERVTADKLAFIEMFHIFYRNNDPLNAQGLFQQHGDRFLIQNPPAFYQTQKELDTVYALGFENAQHPFYQAQGAVKALETVGFSISTHRGCYGECNFCAIAVHEGRTIRWRSQESIIQEAEALTQRPDFKGYIHDLGGPTANMYGYECSKKLDSGACLNKRCLDPKVCRLVNADHRPHTELLRKVRQLHGVKKVFVASGLRYDLLLSDLEHGEDYLFELVKHHTSGQMKIAPEHTEDRVLEKMGKPGTETLVQFKKKFDQMNQKIGKKQFLTYYMIAAHPGCDDRDMERMKSFVSKELQINPEQVQIFTPTPSTYSSLMYYTEMDPFTYEPLFVEKDLRKKAQQKDMLTHKSPPRKKRYG